MEPNNTPKSFRIPVPPVPVKNGFALEELHPIPINSARSFNTIDPNFNKRQSVYQMLDSISALEKGRKVWNEDSSESDNSYPGSPRDSYRESCEWDSPRLFDSPRSYESCDSPRSFDSPKSSGSFEIFSPRPHLQQNDEPSSRPSYFRPIVISSPISTPREDAKDEPTESSQQPRKFSKSNSLLNVHTTARSWLVREKSKSDSSLLIGLGLRFNKEETLEHSSSLESAPPLPPDEEEDEKKQVVYETEDGVRVIRGASVEYFIDSMTHDTTVGDQSYVDTILLTHPLFIPSEKFLEKLVGMYKSSPHPHCAPQKELFKKARIVNAIKRWIQLGDVKENPSLVHQLLQFADELVDPREEFWGRQIHETLGASTKDMRGSKSKFPKLRKLSSLKKAVGWKSTFKFTDVEAKEFANHFTAKDWEMFKKIKAKELLEKAWVGPEKEMIAPNVLQLIDSFNKVCSWVATEILIAPNPKQRTATLEKFIELAKAMKDVQNFHGMFAVYSAMNTVSIQRIKSMWKTVSRKHISMIKEVEDLVDSKRNYKNYRNYLQTIKPPFIPFEGVLLQDITFICENEDTIDGLINYSKMKMLGEILKSLKNAQLIPFHLPECLYLQEYLDTAVILDEEQLYGLSRRIYTSSRRMPRLLV